MKDIISNPVVQAFLVFSLNTVLTMITSRWSGAGRIWAIIKIALGILGRVDPGDAKRADAAKVVLLVGGLSVLLFGCSAASVSRARQTADLLCASIAGSLHSVRGGSATERLMIACLDRLERNEAVEDALALAAAGGSQCMARAGVSGAPDWLPMKSTGTAGAVQ